MFVTQACNMQNDYNLYKKIYTLHCTSIAGIIIIIHVNAAEFRRFYSFFIFIHFYCYKES